MKRLALLGSTGSIGTQALQVVREQKEHFEIELLDIKPPTAATAPASTATPTAVTSDIIKVPSKAELEKGAKIEVIKKEDLEKLQKEGQKATTPAPK